MTSKLNTRKVGNMWLFVFFLVVMRPNNWRILTCFDIIVTTFALKPEKMKWQQNQIFKHYTPKFNKERQLNLGKWLMGLFCSRIIFFLHPNPNLHLPLSMSFVVVLMNGMQKLFNLSRLIFIKKIWESKSRSSFMGVMHVNVISIRIKHF